MQVITVPLKGITLLLLFQLSYQTR